MALTVVVSGPAAGLLAQPTRSTDENDNEDARTRPASDVSGERRNMRCTHCFYLRRRTDTIGGVIEAAPGTASATAPAAPARSLGAAPASFLDARTGEPAYGSYSGPLPAVSLGRAGVLARFARRKRWVYTAIATDEVWIAVAVVRTGYAATAFAFAYDLVGKRMLLDASVLGPAPVARVAGDCHAQGELARFSLGKTRIAMTRGGSVLGLQVRMRDLEIDASIDESAGPPAITAIADLGAGLRSGTEKRGLLPVRGRARCGSRELGLDGGTAGYDYTHGLLPRHTSWRWAFALGRSSGGERFGLNLVQGFVGAAECAAFIGDRLVPLAEPRFAFDAAAPLEPWRITGPAVDLTFTPGAAHADGTNLLLVKSRFIQPVGTFAGTIAGSTVSSLPGVVEDQDILW